MYMKKIVCSLLLIILFVGCYEVNEIISIDENGTGTYATKMDMGTMLQMIQSMAGEEELAKNGLDRVIDTTIHLKSVMDSAENITPEQRRLFNNGTMNLKMNVKESIFKIDMNFPFNSYSDLQTLMSGKGMTGLGEVFKELMSKNDSVRSTAAIPDQAMDQITNVYDVTINKNTISRKLNRERFDSLMKKPEIVQAKQMLGSFEILTTTIIHLPRPAKRVSSDMVTLSDDKKTVTMKYDMLQILDTPDKFSYTIEY